MFGYMISVIGFGIIVWILDLIDLPLFIEHELLFYYLLLLLLLALYPLTIEILFVLILVYLILRYSYYFIMNSSNRIYCYRHY